MWETIALGGAAVAAVTGLLVWLIKSREQKAVAAFQQRLADFAATDAARDRFEEGRAHADRSGTPAADIFDRLREPDAPD